MFGKDSNADYDAKADAAARRIQSYYRGYSTRRALNGCSLSPDHRWDDVLTRTRLQAANSSAAKGDNQVAARWKRTGVFVNQLATSGQGEEEKGKAAGSEQIPSGPSLKSIGGEDPATLKVGNVPGANDGKKIDNVPSIARRKERGLRLIEWWTRSGQAQALSKTLETQHWLEMVDTKHRYGSNLKYYHQAWQEAPNCSQNFFFWLDEGEGKDLSLDSCSREQLDREQITYLSAEQRANYLVDVEPSTGKLFWRRNGKYIDTAKGKHRDSGNGKGIVDLDEDEQAEEAEERKERKRQVGATESDLEPSSSSSSSSSDSSSDEEDKFDKRLAKMDAAHYGADDPKAKHKVQALNAKNWPEMLLRKTVSDNTWIFVMTQNHQLFMGLKKTGTFQHSSFLYGGRVLAAGIFKADNGTLTSLSPLSGHYRAGTAHFRYFVSTLQASKVNLDRVTLSKSLLVLAGLEQYGKLVKKKKKVVQGKPALEKSEVGGEGNDKGHKKKKEGDHPHLDKMLGKLGLGGRGKGAEKEGEEKKA
ncbi:hypothetical protein CF327_g6992 [Tilletia walkeri]|nr:hypothetical protein CF327_g6992 [Tilletia walkeri]